MLTQVLRSERTNTGIHKLGKLQQQDKTISTIRGERDQLSEHHEGLPCCTQFWSGLASWSSDSNCEFNGHVLSLVLGLDYDGNHLFTTSKINLQRGTIYGLVGKNGTGKSSLAKVLASKKVPGFPASLATQYVSSSTSSNNSVISGKLNVREFMLQSARLKETDIDHNIQLLEEEFEELVETETTDGAFETISNMIGELYDKKEELVHSTGKKVEETLLQLGFISSNMLNTTVDNLSCGWRYKCELATIFLTQPDLLVIDEPSFLDMKSSAWFIHKVKEIAKTTQSIVILISHKESLLSALCESILFINPESKTLSVYACTYDNFMLAHGEQVIHAERILKNAKKETDTTKKSLRNFRRKEEKTNRSKIKLIASSRNKTHDQKQTGRAQFGGAMMGKSIAAKERRTQKKTQEIKESIKAYKMGKVDPLNLEGIKLEGVSAEATLLSLQDVTFAYKDGPCVLSNASAQVGLKDKVLIQGKNGQGKSTLVKLLLEELQPDSGTISRNILPNITYFPQTALKTLLNQHGLESSVAFLQRFDTSSSETAIRTYLGKFGLKRDLATRPIRTLSSGQLVRLYLTKEMFVHGIPSLLVMDEVTENLDKESVDSFVETLDRFPGAVLCISHDEYFIEKFSSVSNQSWTLRDSNLNVEFR